MESVICKEGDCKEARTFGRHAQLATQLEKHILNNMRFSAATLLVVVSLMSTGVMAEEKISPLTVKGAPTVDAAQAKALFDKGGCSSTCAAIRTGVRAVSPMPCIWN